MKFHIKIGLQYWNQDTHEWVTKKQEATTHSGHQTLVFLVAWEKYGARGIPVRPSCKSVLKNIWLLNEDRAKYLAWVSKDKNREKNE